MKIINLNKTLGIIGAGQLGKMIGLAAANLGIKVCFYDPDPNAPAKSISNFFYNEKYTNKKKISEFSKKCDFVTYEFENIPVNSLKVLEKKNKVYPNINALKISQDRYLEKSFIRNLGIKTANFQKIINHSSIEKFLKKNQGKGIIKTRRLGYDGKGQYRARLENFKKIKLDLKSNSYIIEKFIPFNKEISVIAVREKNGLVKTFEPSENYHKEGILRKTTFPSSLPENYIIKAKKIAKSIIKKLRIVGILAVEMFVLEDGQILVNEIAPRPHNSGHWTLDGCNISQFEALVRIIFGIPIPKMTYVKQCKMINLLGDNYQDYKKYLTKKNHKVYIYGKSKLKKTRKMGHVNITN